MADEQGFPSRAVLLVEPFGLGGGPDLLARALAERLPKLWGQPVSVRNHAGGGSTAAPAFVAESPPDGHTLLVNTSAHAYSAATVSDLPYDPLRSFAPVAALTSQPYVLVAGGSTGITTVADLVAAARTQAGQIRFASTGVGTGTHLALERLNRALGISAVHAPAGPADAIADVIAGCVAGHTAYAMAPIAIAAPHLESGELAALGVSTARRSCLLPDVPPLAAAGVQSFEFPFWYGVWAPAGTPRWIVDSLARDFASVLASRDLGIWLDRHDATPMNMSPARFAAFVRDESALAARLLSDA